MTTYRLAISLTDETAGYRFSDHDEEVPDWLLREDGTPDTGAIYRECQREYGRCTGSVYVDRDGGPPERIGWHFVSRQQYEDTGEPYLRGAWVSLFTETPAVRHWKSVA